MNGDGNGTPGGMRASIARIDERTQLTHELLKSHMERTDGMHDVLHHRINEAIRHSDDADGVLDKRIDGVSSKTNWILGVGTGAWATVLSFMTDIWDGLMS